MSTGKLLRQPDKVFEGGSGGELTCDELARVAVLQVYRVNRMVCFISLSFKQYRSVLFSKLSHGYSVAITVK